jgi:hypothetical protein
MLNLSLIVLQPVSPLYNYKVWIDTERGEEAKRYLRNIVELNMMEEEFHAHRMGECRRAAYFAMDREEYKEKQEEEGAQKHEKARRAKEAYARGGEKALMKGNLSRICIRVFLHRPEVSHHDLDYLVEGHCSSP